jgi:hypothetical protein
MENDVQKIAEINSKLKLKGYNIHVSKQTISIYYKSKLLMMLAIEKRETDIEVFWLKDEVKKLKKASRFQWKNKIIELMDSLDELFMHWNPYIIHHRLVCPDDSSRETCNYLKNKKKANGVLKDYDIEKYYDEVRLTKTMEEVRDTYKEKKEMVFDFLNKEKERRESFYCTGLDNYDWIFSNYRKFNDWVNYYYIGYMMSIQVEYKHGEILLNMENEQVNIRNWNEKEISDWINTRLDLIYKRQRMDNLYEKPKYFVLRYLRQHFNKNEQVDDVYAYLASRYKNVNLDEIFYKKNIYFKEIKAHGEIKLVQLADKLFVLTKDGAKGFELNEIEMARKYYIQQFIGEIENDINSVIITEEENLKIS